MGQPRQPLGDGQGLLLVQLANGRPWPSARNLTKRETGPASTKGSASSPGMRAVCCGVAEQQQHGRRAQQRGRRRRAPGGVAASMARRRPGFIPVLGSAACGRQWQLVMEGGGLAVAGVCAMHRPAARDAPEGLLLRAAACCQLSPNSLIQPSYTRLLQQNAFGKSSAASLEVALAPAPLSATTPFFHAFSRPNLPARLSSCPLSCIWRASSHSNSCSSPSPAPPSRRILTA